LSYDPSSPDIDSDFNWSSDGAIVHLDDFICVNGSKLVVVAPHGFRSVRGKKCKAISGWLAAAPHHFPNELDRFGTAIRHVKGVAATDERGDRHARGRALPLPPDHSFSIA